MRGSRARARALALAALIAAVAGCADDVSSDPLQGPSDPVEAARAFGQDVRVRRRALEASVAVADTPYATLRAEHYALAGAGIDDAERDWDSLPVFSPRVRGLRVADATGEAERGEGAIAEVDALASLEDWERAGAVAFERTPAQLDLGLDGLRERASALRAGLGVDDDGLVRGAVEVETASGWFVALTCAACHSAVRDGVRVMGVPNDQLDLASLGIASWPRGAIDVTNDGVDDPVRPSDLRPIALQTRLHHTGNLANGRLARMVRIETLLVTQHGMRARPDRRIVAALALYLESLGRALPRPDRASDGALAFERTCGGCHRDEGLAGPVFGVDVVGTDPRSTLMGSERSTLGYRAPSLLGARDRLGLLHDGSAADLDALLGLTPSTHLGHTFGRSLDEDSRRAIASFVRSAR